ncbi:MAG TPA: carboxypeptidase regulatory-like domain-containing protein [Pyrinomonadaceae bacterium]|nr:carboxypeptidase regulatory-like domain-containing protein [Pyrinomonadaceae bacterium]
MFKQTKVWLVVTVALSLLALGSACSKSESETSTNDASSSSAKVYASKGDEGTVKGVVSFNGAPPAPKKIDTSADPVCAQNNPNLTTEDTVVSDGKLANAFVYVKEGTLADGSKFADTGFPTPSEAVTLDQKGCHYMPHVMGIQTNQTLRVTNSDPTQHNVHPTPKNNPEWNQTQANGAAPIEKKFARAEVLIPVKCNQHPWMKAYVGVLKHPYYAVSGQDGSFTLKNVPPGTYTVAAWKEGGATGSEKTMQVTVAANGTAQADFAFGDATASTKPGLQMMPALEIHFGRH